MTNTDYPWEPPMASTETAHLTGALNRLRATFRFKADALDAGGLQVRVGASTLTLGGLLKHLAACEDNMFTVRLSGAPIGARWDSADWDSDADWEINSAAADTPEQLYDLWDGAVERSGPGSARRWRTAAWTSPCTGPAQMASTPACAGWSAT